MYEYTIELVPAKKFCDMNYESHAHIFDEACIYINKGLSFTRDGKELSMETITPDKIVVKLKSKSSLTNPVRSISALTRYLTSNYREVFKNYVYNKTLFSMTLTNTQIINSNSPDDISNEELLKTMIDLLYGYTSKSASDTQKRKKAIDEIKKIILPYYKKS